jgi:tRNA/tmRNA/rRNA uracil-C5-methylase (TrmA/RlmC/RlmD family)
MYLQKRFFKVSFEANNINPICFLSANSPGAEVLYSLIKDSMKLDTETIVLDICCGTGTIGITLANVKLLDFNFKEKNMRNFRMLNKLLELK